MKKVLSLVLLTIFIFALCGCDKISFNNAKEQLSLKTVSDSDKINFDNPHIEISVYSDEAYYFSNRNEEFCERLIYFIENTKFDSQQVEAPGYKDYYTFSIYDDENNHASFSIYEKDIIGKTAASGSVYYFCEGVYNSFKEAFTPFLTEYQKHCRSATTPVRRMHEYVVFDKDNTVMESEYISRTPHLFYDSGIVHLWVQNGTGILSRNAKFFDVEKGLISPEYSGQTDYYGNLVCSTGYSVVTVYDMFSGKELYRFDKFEETPADFFENISSAYFTKDGTQIIVEYRTADGETETQIFDLPKS